MHGRSSASAAAVLKLPTALTPREHHSLRSPTLVKLLWGPSPFSLFLLRAAVFLLREVCVLVRRMTLSYVSSMNRAPRGSLRSLVAQLEAFNHSL